jgi:hypothetical protein
MPDSLIKRETGTWYLFHFVSLHATLKLNTTMKAKPFVKWVGGKTQLIDQLEALLPADFDQWIK